MTAAGHYFVVDLNGKAESLLLQLVLVIQRLDDFEGTGAVVVAHHGEFVGAEPAVLQHLTK